MKKVLLINGTYCVGKSTIAEGVCNNTEISYSILDPDKYYNEKIKYTKCGFLGWPINNSPIFLQHFKALIKREIEKNNLIIPMTISNDNCKKEVVDYLEDISQLTHVILTASEDVIMDRRQNDPKAESRMDEYNIKASIHYIDNNFFGITRIDTTNKAVEEIVKTITSLILGI